MLDPRSIALDGVGYGARSLAMLGLAPASSKIATVIARLSILVAALAVVEVSAMPIASLAIDVSPIAAVAIAADRVASVMVDYADLATVEIATAAIATCAVVVTEYP